MSAVVAIDSAGSTRVGDKVALSVPIDDAGEGGLHCPSSFVVLQRLKSDSTAVDVRWSSFPDSYKHNLHNGISINTKGLL